MKKIYMVLAVVFALSVGQASAQNWKDLLGKVVETVTNGDESGNSEAGVLGNILGNILGSSVELTEKSMEGNWKYTGIAFVYVDILFCYMEGDPGHGFQHTEGIFLR